MPFKAGTHYPHVTWAHVMLRVQLGCKRRFNVKFYDVDSLFCHSAHVTWSHVELWSAHAPARLSHFCCRTHFVRRDQRVECRATVPPSTETNGQSFLRRPGPTRGRRANDDGVLLSNFTFMLQWIVIDLFLNNQPDAKIIQILFCYKTLHVSGLFSAHHREFSTVHSAMVSFVQVADDRFQTESILTLLGSGHQKPAWNLPVPNVQ